MRPVGRRTFLRSCVGASAALLAGCSESGPDEVVSKTTRTATTTTDATATTYAMETDATATTDATTTDPPTTTVPDRPLSFTVYPDEVSRIVTPELSPTADCKHATALATDEREADQFDWEAAEERVREFARATDFESACLLAVRTTSPGPVEYEVDWIARPTETTLRVHTTAEAVPGPSAQDTDTRLVRVALDDEPAPSRVVVVRTTDYDDSRFTFATDDAACSSER